MKCQAEQPTIITSRQLVLDRAAAILRGIGQKHLAALVAEVPVPLMDGCDLHHGEEIDDGAFGFRVERMSHQAIASDDYTPLFLRLR
jgi:hypothetical protein